MFIQRTIGVLKTFEIGKIYGGYLAAQTGPVLDN